MITSAAPRRITSTTAYFPHEAWLAARFGDSAARPHLRERIDVVHQGGLLDVLDHGRRHPAKDANCGARAPLFAPASTRSFGPVPDCLTRSVDELDIAFLVDPDLVVDGLEATLHRITGAVDHHAEVVIALHEIHGGEGESKRTAHERAHRLVQVLADSVPARHLQAAEHETGGAVERVPARTHHFRGQFFARRRGLADELLRHLLEDGSDHIGVRAHRHDDLADPHHSIVHVQLDEAHGVTIASAPRPSSGCTIGRLRNVNSACSMRMWCSSQVAGVVWVVSEISCPTGRGRAGARRR